MIKFAFYYFVTVILFVNAERIHVPNCPSLFDVDISNSTTTNLKDVSKCYCDNVTENASSLVQVNCLYSSKLSDLTTALKAVVNAKKEVYSIYLQDFDFSANAVDVPDEYFLKLDAAPKELVIVNCLNTNLLLFGRDTFRGLENTLQSIKIEKCKLVVLPIGIKSLKKLEALVLKNTDITTLRKDDLNNLTNLKVLELSGNSIKTEQGVFDNLKNLRSLKISTGGNLNSSIFDEISSLTTLTSLDLSGNDIKDIGNKLFSKFKQLEYLNLNFNFINKLTTKAFEDLSKLVNLDLRVNLITNIEEGTFNELKNLDQLQLAGNYLNDIKPVVFNLPNLTKLDLSYNEISTVKKDALKNCPKLRKFNLDKNEKLTSFDSGAFNGLKNLKYLNLSYTNIKTFDTDLFKPINDLFLLDLSNTNISSLDPKQFSNLKNLSVLLIKSTKLQTFSDDIFTTAKNLKRIEAANNQWICDKKLGGLVKFLQNRESNRRLAEKFRSSDVAKCWLPVNFRDLPLVALNLNKKTL